MKERKAIIKLILNINFQESQLQLRPSIHCMQLNEKNILICGGLDGVVQIVDIHLGKLVTFSYPLITLLFHYRYHADIMNISLLSAPFSVA